ncbi:GntR family transcriptional regulator [Siccirubricoccus sp. KC 17139]|uniref:GntR family transcriptional regulator n=1 Tax=Siccirubricoccus soli TaxID=2899147 RepID=A0ABT1D382_9PROT|nr:GntR family transcriptional regulator [Siccirubricoccus soli]MCO6416392.1 GntR family transcriptional regulator [Siccirubricoccus soli]MCP2682526.1 GntR family transcriptional regulator [Siccirubricoccus soli]
MIGPLPAPTERSPTPSLVESAYAALKHAIRTNVFAPGYQGSEQEIAAQLGMSRTPVHEAIIRLQEEGLVRVLPRRGVVVCALSPEDMREIYEVVIALESASAGLIAAREDREAAAATLEAANAEMASALAREDLVAWAEADERFHQRLVEGSGNRRLARIFETVMDQSHRARLLTLRLRPKPVLSVEEHKGIVAAIRTGEVAAAEGLARAHRARARDQLLPLLRQLGMRHL